jgi:hypothetical protein
MPLKKGSSKATVSQNIGEMRRSGYPEKQAVAASLNSARRTGKTAPRIQMRKTNRRGHAR